MNLIPHPPATPPIIRARRAVFSPAARSQRALLPHRRKGYCPIFLCLSRPPGFSRAASHTDEPKSSFANLSDLGFVTGPGTLGIIPSGPPGFPQTVPPIYFNGFSLGVNTLTTFQPNNTWHVSDTYSKSKGVHTFKFGGEFRYLQINERNICAPNGDFTFDGSITGTDFADFLLGAAQNYNQCSQQFLDSRSRYGGGVFSDNLLESATPSSNT